MKYFTSVTALLVASGSFVSALSLFGSSARQVEATASFPETNPFSHIVNGQNNPISVVIHNKEDVEIDVKKIFGSFKEPGTEKLIRNTTAIAYTASIPAKQKATIPYTFYSEFKPQDLRLQLWVEYAVGGQPHQSQAFDSVVSVVEPPASWFDPVLILTYLLIAGTLGGAGYLTYTSLYPQKKKKVVATPSAPVSTVTATNTATGYQEEWIPEHHLKNRKKKDGGALSSGDDSGPEKRASRKKR